MDFGLRSFRCRTCSDKNQGGSNSASQRAAEEIRSASRHVDSFRDAGGSRGPNASVNERDCNGRQGQPDTRERRERHTGGLGVAANSSFGYAADRAEPVNRSVARGHHTGRGSNAHLNACSLASRRYRNADASHRNHAARKSATVSVDSVTPASNAAGSATQGPADYANARNNSRGRITTGNHAGAHVHPASPALERSATAHPHAGKHRRYGATADAA